MNPEHLSQRHSIVGEAAKIASINLDSLFNSEKIGTELSFRNDDDVFRRCIWVTKHITHESLDRLPPHYLTSFRDYVRDVSARLADAINFTPGRQDAFEHRKRITVGIDTSLRELMSSCPSMSLIFANSSSEITDQMKNAYAAFIEQSEATKTKLENDAKARLNEIDEVLSKARQASQTVAGQGYARFFLSEAKEAREAAVRWLTVTAALGVVMLVALVYIASLWAEKPPTYTPPQAILVGAAKLAVFSVAVFLLAWCGKNFKAQWHVFIVNKHRANALNSIEAFANASKSDANREAILVHGCAAIFSQTNTGFVPDSSDSPQVPSVLEVIRRGGD